MDRRGTVGGSPTSYLLKVALRKKLLVFSPLRTPARVLLASVSLLSAHPPQKISYVDGSVMPRATFSP